MSAGKSPTGMGNQQQRNGKLPAEDGKLEEREAEGAALPASLDLAALLPLPTATAPVRRPQSLPHSYSQTPSPLFQHPALAGPWEFHNPLLVPLTPPKPLKIAPPSSLTSFQLPFELTIFPLGKEQLSRTNSWPQPGTISTNLWGPVMRGQAPH